ncbi:hypothetical protein BK138_02060 [Paenibacillus rhizosphaerae]|uniref:Uncharacterized protein n=1 Tax=Paenibacillus rhizosphaerae TaxID=297318 RepID=A0A1R1F033_9BACL|nr:hypothetical protein BK138_02060 [Paenibacillus rhizosphaerae]
MEFLHSPGLAEWSNESGLLAIQRASRAGYDLLEVSPVKPDTFDSIFAYGLTLRQKGKRSNVCNDLTDQYFEVIPNE